LVKAAGMNTQHVVNVLKIANNHLPAVEQRYENLTRQVYSLEGDKRNSAMILHELSNQITELQNTSESYHSSCEEERRQMGELYEKKDIVQGLGYELVYADTDSVFIKRKYDDIASTEITSDYEQVLDILSKETT